MTTKDRAYLKGLAMNIDPVLSLGKSSLTPEFVAAASEALEARELIKISVLETAPDTAKDLSIDISNSINTEVIQVIGNKITLFRQKKKDSRYQLPN